MRAVSLLVVFAALTVEVACNSQPITATTPVSPSTGLMAPDPLAAFVGSWRGDALVTACSGGGRRYSCTAPGTQYRFWVQFARSGARLVGLWGSMDLVGTLGADGRLTLTGGEQPVTYELPQGEVESMWVRLSETGTLEGEATLVGYPPTAILESSAPVRSTQRLSGATRQPEALAPPFTGTFTGWFEEVFTGHTFFTDPVRDLSFSLVQNGASVAGSMTMTFLGTIPLTGHVDGDTAVLTGEIERNGVTVRVVEFTVRSELGRLNGTYRLVYPTAQPLFRLARVVLTGPPS